MTARSPLNGLWSETQDNQTAESFAVTFMRDELYTLDSHDFQGSRSHAVLPHAIYL